MTDVKHYLHILLTLYLMMGWLLPNVELYVASSLVVLSGWHIFGECVMNRGMDYPDNSFVKGVVARMGFDSTTQDNALRNFMFLYFFGLVVSTCKSVYPRYFKCMIYLYVLISMWVFQSADIKKLLKG